MHNQTGGSLLLCLELIRIFEIGLGFGLVAAANMGQGPRLVSLRIARTKLDKLGEVVDGFNGCRMTRIPSLLFRHIAGPIIAKS
jgi:hypothetical protein